MVEQHATFLVRWAEELFAEWATWIKQAVPGCEFTYKSSTSRIVKKIKAMAKSGKVQEECKGWLKVTDMLRARHFCASGKEVMNILMVMNKSDRVSIMRIKPRLQHPKNLNDVIINFDYEGKMICELQIKLVKSKFK